MFSPRAAETWRIAGPIHSARISEPIAADPTHHQAATPPDVAARRRADRRSGPDIGGEHRREEQAGPEPPAGDEKIRRAPHAAADPQSERHQQERVGAEDEHVEVHRLKSRSLKSHARSSAQRPGTRVTAT